MALSLPKLRWLLIGAIAAGIWVVREDMKAPRPPERVQSPAKQRTDAKPVPKAPMAAKRPLAKAATATSAADKPVPPLPVAAKKPERPASHTPEPGRARTALALPGTVQRPPVKPHKVTTGSVTRPDSPSYVQTTAAVRLRAQARTDSEIITMLEPRTVMRELARSGKWRLVMGEGRKGWVHTDYLDSATYLARRPKLPVSAIGRTETAQTPVRKP